MPPADRTQAVYVISVAAELAGMHPRRCASTSAAGLVSRPARRAATAATATPTSRGCAASPSSPPRA